MKRFVFAFLIPFSLFAQPQDFSEAKRELIKIYKDLGELKEFYCNAPFKIDGKNKLIIIKSEAFSPRLGKNEKPSKRAKNIEWAHILPMSMAYSHSPCWREGGRKRYQKMDKNFKKLEADMFNLVPSIGSINGDRSNYTYAQMPRGLEFNQYGKCKVFVDFKNKKFYPADYSKGYIARTYLYMSKTYNIRLSDQERSLMNTWNEEFPMDERERSLRDKISKIMGVDFFEVMKGVI